MSAGRLAVVGLGPGDPELVTIKAARLIAAADVVAFPHAEGGEAFARKIAAPYVRPGQRELAFALPMRPDPAEARAAYRAAAAAIAAELRRGRTVALLCEGDPLFYGSSARLLEFLDEFRQVEVVPGIASPHAAAARLGHAIARRDEVFKVLPATLAPNRLEAELRAADAAAILKLGRRFDAVRALCDRLGFTARAVLVEHATLPAERTVPLAAAEPGAKPYFSLILIPRADEASEGRMIADVARERAAIPAKARAEDAA